MRRITFFLMGVLCYLLSNTVHAQTLDIYADEQPDIEARIEQDLVT